MCDMCLRAARLKFDILLSYELKGVIGISDQRLGQTQSILMRDRIQNASVSELSKYQAARGYNDTIVS